MTILIITDYYPPDRIGGVGTIARGLADAYRALGHRVLVLTTGSSRGEAGVIRGARNLVWGVLTNNARALRIIAKERVDLVHLHQAGSTLFLPVARLRRNRPFVICSLQVSYLSEAREMRGHEAYGMRWRATAGERVERFLLAPAHIVLDFIGFALSDVVTTVSRDNRDELRRSYGRLVRRPVKVVPNGVAPSGEHAEPDFRDAALEDRLRGKVVIGYLGVFRARKRVANLIVAFRDVAQRCPNAVLLVVGGGRGYERLLRGLAEQLGVADSVVFTGSVRPDRSGYYLSLMDIVCLLSSYEGMPMALLEAMQQGKAVVATDRYGMRDLLGGGTAGAPVPLDDIPATVRALETLVRAGGRRREIGSAARERIRARFTWDRIARGYLALATRA